MMSKDRCPNCGATLHTDQVKKIRSCEYCGTNFSMEDLTQTVHYIDEARLKEAELKEKIFESEQKERAYKEKREKNQDRNKKVFLTLLVVSLILATVTQSSAFWGLFIVSVILLITNKKRNDKGRVQPQRYRTNEQYALDSDKDKVVALLLCLFLGGLGAHHFYVGRIGKGILYIFTFGLFGIGILIDIILIASGKFKDSDKRVLR